MVCSECLAVVKSRSGLLRLISSFGGPRSQREATTATRSRLWFAASAWLLPLVHAFKKTAWFRRLVLRHLPAPSVPTSECRPAHRLVLPIMALTCTYLLVVDVPNALVLILTGETVPVAVELDCLMCLLRALYIGCQPFCLP